MFYEEMVIEGVLHWRSTPNGQWHRMSEVMLTKKLMEERGRVDSLRGEYAELLEYKRLWLDQLNREREQAR